MEYQSVLKRMPVELQNPVIYYLDMGNDFIIVNNLLNKKIKISFDTYKCLSCGSDEPIFAQGMCKKCYFENPSVGEWIMKPELSKAHLGIEHRDLEYEQQVQLQPHIVYLAKTSDIKVGVTRKSQVPTRWIDQGADQAIALLETPNRFLAGQAEVLLKNYFSDKTSWQKMLKGIITDKDLLLAKEKVKELLNYELKKYWIEDNELVEINYPVIQYPEKVISLNLNKISEFEKELKGVKGQYLIFYDGSVFNVRNHSGFVVKLSF